MTMKSISSTPLPPAASARINCDIKAVLCSRAVSDLCCMRRGPAVFELVTGCIASIEDSLDGTLESPLGQGDKHLPAIEDDKHSAAHEALNTSQISELALPSARSSGTAVSMAARLGNARNRRRCHSMHCGGNVLRFQLQCLEANSEHMHVGWMGRSASSPLRRWGHRIGGSIIRKNRSNTSTRDGQGP